MNCKLFLKFYFFSDSLEIAFNNLIYSKARAAFTGERSMEFYSEEIIKLTEEKIKLGEVWEYLDGIIKNFCLEEKKVLRYYGGLRGGLSKLSEDKRREVRRVVTKFSRRAKSSGRYSEAVGLLKKYYCLLNTSPSG